MKYQNSTYLYYDLQKHQYCNPLNANIPVTSIGFVSGDSTMLRVQFVNNTNGLTINDDYTVPVSYAVDMSDYPLFVFGIKTRQNWQSGSVFTQAFVQYDTNDYFYNPTSGSFSIPIGIVNSTSSTGSYVCSYKLQTSSGSALTAATYAPLECEIVNPVVVGTEGIIPPVPSNIGTATILSGSNSVVVTFANITPTAEIFVSWLSNPWSTLGVVAGIGSFEVVAGGLMPQDSIIAYNIYSLTS